MTNSNDNNKEDEETISTEPYELHEYVLHYDESSSQSDNNSIVLHYDESSSQSDNSIVLHYDESSSQSDNSTGSSVQFDQSKHTSYLDDTNKLKNFLTNWSLKNHITHTALSSLLQELKNYQHFSTLPRNARTLLGTPLHSIQEQTLIATTIEVAINVDGLPLSKSSGISFWPILRSILPCGKVFIIGVYCGKEKPKNINAFLHDFVSETIDLCTNGIFINNSHYLFKIKYFVCDAPAKSYILQCRGHTGYYSCTKCTVEGVYKQNRICFPDINAPKRTDEGFSYHISYTLLEQIPNLDFVQDFVLDYMHLICLGVVRKLLNLWINGSTGYRLQYYNIERISAALENLKRLTPKEFARKPRSLKYLKLWKATEYRQLLLYTEPIVLKHIISQDNYNLFISLHVAIRILCNENTKNVYVNYAEELLKHFIESFGRLYGKHHISHNIHGLSHLIEDVKNFGILDNFSAFRFENFMQILKKLVRKSEKPLQQLFRRYCEAQHITTETKKTNKKLNPIKSTYHCNGPLLPLSNFPQYKSAECTFFKLDANSIADNCCGLQDNTILLLRNIAYSTESKDLVIIDQQFECKDNYYNTPCDSSVLGIYKVSQLSQLKMWPLRSVNKKYAKYVLNNDVFVVIPLLHNEIIETTEL
ncbi:hypothetical protein ALC62_15262 [Cyphomyrmex costatus]|uniref:Transposase domain-containing protein n=1 Tax=Cyphomyrmex costatus TaxID=456900 RepID=A0A151I7Q3_9HYME|nr:hypothetical protein ALC62_15262 [Cyphomyrmex costatus]